MRILSVPHNDLKKLQQKLLTEIFYKVRLPNYLHGGILKKSIITNARSHINQQWVINFDIKSFFPSIRISKIEKAIQKHFPIEWCNAIVRLITHNHCLPQGAPTSPFVSNLIFLDHDRAIFNFCRENHLNYTRYFDDITVSGKHATKFVVPISKIIEQSGLKINKDKLLVQPRQTAQYVTGLIVNKRLTAPPGMIQEIIDFIDVFTISGMQAFATAFPIKELDSLRGKISFINQTDKKLSIELGNKLDRILKEIDF